MYLNYYRDVKEKLIKQGGEPAQRSMFSLHSFIFLNLCCKYLIWHISSCLFFSLLSLFLHPTPPLFFPLFQALNNLVSFVGLIELVIEEITEEAVSTGNGKCSAMENCVTQPQKNGACRKSQSGTNGEDLTTNSEYLQTLKDDPEAIRFVSIHKGIVHLIVILA